MVECIRVYAIDRNGGGQRDSGRARKFSETRDPARCPWDMRLTLAGLSFAALLAGCRVDSPAPPLSALDAEAETPTTPTPAATSGGRFFARTDSGQARALALKMFSVEVKTNPGTVRSHLRMDVAGVTSDRLEAIMRVAVPRGAAVTSAVLWVNGRPMNGAFVQRDRAREIYRSIVERRRDPALVSWDGPGWIAVSIFPLERGESRRIELEWIEPAATGGGFLQYRVPVIAEAGCVVGRPSLKVDGQPVAIGGRDVVPIAPAPAGVAQIVFGRAPGDPFARLLVRASAVEGAPRLVLIAETSAAMTPADRLRQRAAIVTVLTALSPSSKVTILAVDWGVSVIAEDVDPADARGSLVKLDGIVSAGALHLERALGSANAHARSRTATAVLFVGRGFDGFGGDAIRAPLRQLGDHDIHLSVIATNEIPQPLGDAAALTGGEVLPAHEVERDVGALVDALKPRPRRPARARDDHGTNGLDGTLAGGAITARGCGRRSRHGGSGGSVAIVGSCAPVLVGSRRPPGSGPDDTRGADTSSIASGTRDRAGLFPLWASPAGTGLGRAPFWRRQRGQDG